MYRLSLFITLLALSAGCDRAGTREQSNPVTPAQDRVVDRSNHGADEDVQIQTIPVAGTIYMLVGKGGNIGVSVGEDGILIIDDQFAPLADKIRTALAAWILRTLGSRTLSVGCCSTGAPTSQP